MVHRRHCDEVARFLRRRGAWVLRIRATWGIRRGTPDILACWRGRMVAVEVKTGRGALSPAQREELASLRACGAIVAVGGALSVVQQIEEQMGAPPPT